MKIFTLPDLGEGLPEAEIREWYVAEGDVVTLDQPLASMETAKAIVDVPSPRAGTISKLCGEVDDIIKTGAALVIYTDGDEESISGPETAATVVGDIKVGKDVINETATGVTQHSGNAHAIQILPAVRALAKQLQIDLTTLTGTGPDGRITLTDIQQVASTSTPATTPKALPPEAEILHGPRRAMAHTMTQSHASVVPVTIVDDADIQAWPEKTDITVRVIRALIAGIKQVPTLNAWFYEDSIAIQTHPKINLGLAIDTPDGLFVPVIKDVATLSDEQLRNTINRFKTQVRDRSLAPEEFNDATITLSNYGTIAGRYANPVIVPPCVAIIGTGRIQQQAVVNDGAIEAHRLMPLSLTVDHRVICGGEAIRFLAAIIESLKQATL